MELKGMEWNGKGCDGRGINLEQLSKLIDLLMRSVWGIKCQ